METWKRYSSLRVERGWLLGTGPRSEMRHGGKGKGGDGVTFKCVARPPHAEVCCALAHVVLE